MIGERLQVGRYYIYDIVGRYIICEENSITVLLEIIAAAYIYMIQIELSHW